MDLVYDENLINIQKFFNLIYYKENATREEIYNFFISLTKYVFKCYGFNYNDYEIVIHFVDGKILGENKAEMIQDETNINKYHIKLNKKQRSYKCTCNADVADFIDFIFTYLHELGHVIQYIESPDVMEYEDLNMQNLDSTVQILSAEMKNSKEKRLIIKSLEKHIDCLAYMHNVEKEANSKAHRYFCAILSKLIAIEEDEELVKFMCSIYCFINKCRKENFASYRKYININKQTLNKLESLDWEDRLLEIIDKN